jgi:hypothetical protein
VGFYEYGDEPSVSMKENFLMSWISINCLRKSPHGAQCNISRRKTIDVTQFGTEIYAFY